MGSKLTCCPTMVLFQDNDSGCIPHLSDGYIAACDGSFRYDDEWAEDPRKQLRSCPWCGKEIKWPLS